MKIINISAVAHPISVSLKKKSGEFVEVMLSQEEYVFTDSSEETKSMVIQARKGNIKAIQEDKPVDAEYYVVYGNADVLGCDDNLVHEVSETEETHMVLMGNPIEGQSDDKIASEEIKTNKGGRPKGSKNKKKRGRPKMKRAPGRPPKKKPSSVIENVETREETKV
jgi:hypothetical protein